MSSRIAFGTGEPEDLSTAQAALAQARQSSDSAVAALAAAKKRQTETEDVAATSVAKLKKGMALRADATVIAKLEAAAAKASLTARQAEDEVADAERQVTVAKTELQVAQLAVRMATLQSVADIEKIAAASDAAKDSADGAKTAAEGAKTAANDAKQASDDAKVAAEAAKTAAIGAESAAKATKDAADGIQDSANRLEDAATIATKAANQAQQAAERIAQAPGPDASPASTAADDGATDVSPSHPADEATKDCTSIDPFVRLPMVTTIGVASDFDDFCPANVEHDDKNRCDCGRKFVRDFRFEAAAHFPLTAFGMRGESMEHEGAVIYEGMRFAMSDDGHYQVRFALGTPAMPVTLRLQLLLEDSATKNRYTLTLPPITIPEPNQPQHTTQRREVDPVYAKVQTVHHEGYSPTLVNRSPTINVVRSGGAGVGFVGLAPKLWGV